MTVASSKPVPRTIAAAAAAGGESLLYRDFCVVFRAMLRPARADAGLPRLFKSFDGIPCFATTGNSEWAQQRSSFDETGQYTIRTAIVAQGLGGAAAPARPRAHCFNSSLNEACGPRSRRGSGGRAERAERSGAELAIQNALIADMRCIERSRSRRRSGLFNQQQEFGSHPGQTGRSARSEFTQQQQMGFRVRTTGSRMSAALSPSNSGGFCGASSDMNRQDVLDRLRENEAALRARGITCRLVRLSRAR